MDVRFKTEMNKLVTYSSVVVASLIDHLLLKCDRAAVRNMKVIVGGEHVCLMIAFFSVINKCSSGALTV